MGMGYFGSVGFMLAQVLLGLLLLLPVLRVILPLSRVRFGNPVCQAVYRATNPLLVPLGRVLPNWRGLSLGALVLAWLVAALAAWLLPRRPGDRGLALGAAVLTRPFALLLLPLWGGWLIFREGEAPAEPRAG